MYEGPLSPTPGQGWAEEAGHSPAMSRSQSEPMAWEDPGSPPLRLWLDLIIGGVDTQPGFPWIAHASPYCPALSLGLCSAPAASGNQQHPLPRTFQAPWGCMELPWLGGDPMHPAGCPHLPRPLSPLSHRHHSPECSPHLTTSHSPIPSPLSHGDHCSFVGEETATHSLCHEHAESPSSGSGAWGGQPTAFPFQ